MIKVLSVFGTRPEAIKMAPVIKELETRPDKFTSMVCVTAQHREMLDQVLDVFNIKTDYDLNLMRSDQNLFEITSRALEGLEPMLKEVRPDIVLGPGGYHHRLRGGPSFLLSSDHGGPRRGGPKNPR